MSPIQYLRTPRRTSWNSDRKHAERTFSCPHCAPEPCADAHHLAQFTKKRRTGRRRGSFSLFERRKREVRTTNIDYPQSDIIPMAIKKKRTFVRPFFSFSKRSSSNRSHSSKHSLISLNSETAVGDILQQQLGSTTGRRFESKQTGRLLHKDREDYITARGANPRTGVVSPGQNSSLGGNSDELNIASKKRAFIAQTWRQKNNQWVSMGVTRKLTSGTSRPMLRSKQYLRKSLKPSSELDSSDRSEDPTQCSNDIVIPSKTTSELHVPVHQHMHNSEDDLLFPGGVSESVAIETAVDAPPHGPVNSAITPAKVFSPKAKARSYHWGDAAVSHCDIPPKSSVVRGQQICGIDSSAAVGALRCAAPCESGRVKLAPPSKSTSPENQLSRVTESSETDNQKIQQLTQSSDSLAQLNDGFIQCLIGETSHTFIPLVNPHSFDTAAQAVNRPLIKRRNAEKGSLGTMRRLARSREFPKEASSGPTHFRIKRKPLGDRPNPGLLECFPKASCTNAAARQASRRVNGSITGSKRARKLGARNRRLNDISFLEASKLSNPINMQNRNSSPANTRLANHSIGTTDGASDRKVAASAKPHNMESSSSGQHISSGELGNDPEFENDLPPDIVGEESLPMTAFLFATLMFIRDFIMDRKTFKYFILIFGYLLQMISHTLCVALVICNAFFIGLRTASPRQSCAYLREIKYFSDDLYHALCYMLLLTFVFGAAWKFVDYFFESIGLLLRLYRVLRGFTSV